jgi:hypothetical protein
MAVFRAGIAVVLAAFGIWMTVQLVNRPDRWPWLSRMVQPMLLKLAVGYFVISAVTLPFLDTWWLGELPLLALIQLPKVALAHWCQWDLVMKGMHIAGLSKGSVSPDLIASRPWGLLLAYFFALVPIFAVVWFHTRMTQPYGRAASMLAAAAVIDFVVTLLLAGGPGLTIY